MKRLLALLAAIPLALPLTALAAEPVSAHGTAVYDSSVSAIYAPENAVGAPDGAYADYHDELGYVTLDMGEDGAEGDLTLTYQVLEFGAMYEVAFLDANAEEIERANDSFEMYSTELDVAYTGTEPYRYVTVTCVTNKLWRLDAVSAVSAATSEETPVVEEPAETPTEEETPSAQGLLVKLVDDADPNTTVDAAVYEIGADGMRHAFPSLAVYESWYHDFENIALIDPDNLASYALGDNVTVRPGTKLVKIQSNVKVYAVGTDATLHWVTTEELAVALYGADWAERVIDIPDTYWGNYTVGDPITTELHPDGTLGVRADGSVVYLGEETVYTFASGAKAYMRLSSDDYVRVTEADESSRPLTGELVDDPDVAFPY